MNFVANRLNRIKPSMTVGINIKAKAMKEEGKDVIVLAAGEPDFNTPKNILNAAWAVVSKNINRAEKKLWTDNYDGDKIDLFEAAERMTKELENRIKNKIKDLNE